MIVLSNHTFYTPKGASTILASPLLRLLHSNNDYDLTTATENWLLFIPDCKMHISSFPFLHFLISHFPFPISPFLLLVRPPCESIMSVRAC